MNDGWIKIHRKLKNWEWADSPEMMCVWMHILLDASYEDNQWHGHTIKRGQLVIGREKFAAECGVSVQNLRTCLNRLVECNQIVRESTNKYTIITICKFDDYQVVDDDVQPAINQQLTNNQPAINQQLTTTKEIKKERKKENNKSSSSARVRTCEEVVREIGFYWNSKINIPTKQIPAIDDSNPERLGRMLKILETYGEERIKTAIDIVSRNDYLLGVTNFDKSIVDAVNLEKTLSGYYDKRETQKTKTDGTRTVEQRNHVTKTEGDFFCDF